MTGEMTATSKRAASRTMRSSPRASARKEAAAELASAPKTRRRRKDAASSVDETIPTTESTQDGQEHAAGDHEGTSSPED